MDSTCPCITCFKCHKPEHISRDCKFKKYQIKCDSRSSSCKPRDNSSDFRRDLSRGLSPRYNKSKPIVIVWTASKLGLTLLKRLHRTVGGCKVKLLVDSRAVALIINYRTYKALGPIPLLGRSNRELFSYTGQAITVLGQTKATVICGNTRIFDFNFIFVK